MDRLISADALKEVFKEKGSEAVCGVELCKAIISQIDNQPTVDPIRHGRWIYHIGERFTSESTQECSICHEHEYITLCHETYCPNCGSKMDGERREK